MNAPSIACIGIIGKNNNPLHITIFPTLSTSPPTAALTPLQFSLLLSSTLDIFEARRRANVTANGGLSGDYGLLKNIDERLAAYGFETNTGVKFVAVVDLLGAGSTESAGAPAADMGKKIGLGLREGEMKVVFRAIHAAYIRLLQNPFYDPDEHSPATGRGGKKIESRKFAMEIQRIGEKWRAGMTTL